MAPDLVALTCPRCSAHLRPGAPWCTQCFLDLAPTPAAPVVEPPLPPEVAAPDVAVPDLAACNGPTAGPGTFWPCPACGTRNRLSAAVCGTCQLGFLAGARAEDTQLLDLPLVGDLARLSGPQRMILAFVAVVAVMLATAALGAIFH